jgi:hypothetical protein
MLVANLLGYAVINGGSLIMSPEQLLTLKALAQADQTAAGYIAVADDQALATWLNTNQPTHYVWRSSLTPDQARAAIFQGASQLDALTVGKRDSLLWLLSESVSPADANIRTAIDDLCGSQNTLKGALQTAQRRTTSRAEKALASGTGTYASPAILGWEGTIDAATASGVRVA